MTSDQPPSSNGPGKGDWLSRLRSRLGISPRDRSEIKEILHQARSEGVFDTDEAAMLDGVLEVSETQVREVMVPRSQMVVIERGASANELLPLIIDSGHSRFPVIGEDRDEVVGILLAKDLLRYFSSAADGEFDMREYMRTPVFIPESKRLRTLLKEFRASHNHMAIVVDEYGAVAGLLTIEDVLEQIVGDIDDEHDIEDQIEIRKDSDRCFFVSAQTRIDDFNEYFGSDFSDEEYGTVGGLVLHEMGRLPGRGESVSVERFHFKVTRAGRRRIDTLEVTVEHGVIPGTAVDA